MRSKWTLSQYHLKEMELKKKEDKTLQNKIKIFSKLYLVIVCMYVLCVNKQGSGIKL